MISRVSNEYILHLRGTAPLSSILLRRQLNLYGKIARLPMNSVMRNLVFEHQSCHPKTVESRRRGRPRLEWSSELHKIVERMLHSMNKEEYFLNAELATKGVAIHRTAIIMVGF